MFSFVRLWRRIMTRNLRKVPPKRPYRRAVLESLEERLTPSASSQAYVDALYQSILHRPAMGGEDAGFIIRSTMAR